MNKTDTPSPYAALHRLLTRAMHSPEGKRKNDNTYYFSIVKKALDERKRLPSR